MGGFLSLPPACTRSKRLTDCRIISILVNNTQQRPGPVEGQIRTSAQALPWPTQAQR